MNNDKNTVIYTPENEPYLGSELLFHLDQVIISAMEQNSKTASSSHQIELNEYQEMACQVIAQSISILLSIRELIRQGYLFGGYVLARSLVERTAIIHYLHLYPDEIGKWNNGWNYREAPSLAKMFEAIQKKLGREDFVKGYNLTKDWNSLVHGKPDSAMWNYVFTKQGRLGHASSKILNRPELCDDLCANIIPYVVIILSMMVAYFPN